MVHPIAEMAARTTAGMFVKAQQWVTEHNVFLVDVSWNWAHDEPEPFTLAVYFTFERDPEAEDEPAGRDRTVHPSGRPLRNLSAYSPTPRPAPATIHIAGVTQPRGGSAAPVADDDPRAAGPRQ